MSSPTEPSRGQLLVGISISEPPESELIRLGLSELHIRHAFVELARHLLAAGHALAYGGDFRQQGYTETMLDLVRTYSASEQPEADRVVVYSAWPLWLSLDANDHAEIASVAKLVSVPRPPEAPERLPASRDPTPSDRYWAALALTEMRKQMNREVDARVLLGGRLSGQAGLLPGVVEEAALAIEDALPLFVIGGFGGAASVVGAAIRGQSTPELSLKFQHENTLGYSELWNEAVGRRATVDFDDLRRDLARHGHGVRNGLSSDENTRLLATSDIDEIAALVLRGLKAFLSY